MSNRRKLRPTGKVPPHEHNGGEHIIHFCGDPDCPGDDCPNTELDMHLCDRGYDDALAVVQAEAAITCPVCGCDEHATVRIGRQWLGEPRFICHCCHGCDEKAMAAGLEAQNFDPSRAPMTALCPSCQPDAVTAGMLAPVSRHHQP